MRVVAGEAATLAAEHTRAIRNDYDWVERQRRCGLALAASVILEWCLLAAQLAGILGFPASFLQTEDGSRNTLGYHALCSAQTASCALQLACVTRWYQLRLRRLALFDRLWAATGLWDSVYRTPWLAECALLALHEPPFAVLLWRNAHKLQLAALLKAYVFFDVFRGQSYCATIGGRLVCTIARIRNTKLFQLRYWMHQRPTAFILACAAGGWLFLSVAMYIAESGHLSLDEAMWLTFITMTTVGYGDFSPTAGLGRMVAVVAALHGVVSTALLISIVNNLFSMTEPQRRVAEFICESKEGSAIEATASLIVKASLMLVHARARGLPTRPLAARIRRLCVRSRELRQHFRKFQLSVHNPSEAFNVNTRLNQMEANLTRLLCQGPPKGRAGHAWCGSGADSPQDGVCGGGGVVDAGAAACGCRGCGAAGGVGALQVQLDALSAQVSLLLRNQQLQMGACDVAV